MTSFLCLLAAAAISAWLRFKKPRLPLHVVAVLVILALCAFSLNRTLRADPAPITWNGGTEYTVVDAPDGYAVLHFGTAFSFSQAVPNGEYLVTLSFIEPVVLGPGGRVFDVSINDGPVISHLDLTAKAGFMVPMTRSVIVAVTGGVMLFNFSATVRSAVVSGVTIEPLTNWI
jgi:hypothetical protein